MSENDPLDDIFSDDWPEDHRSGVVAIVGRPNVGKSTLVNRILGQKVAIVTSKPQTTRKRQLGIYSEENCQILFTDTPGLHRPRNRLGEYMIDAAESAVREADVVLWVLDASEPPQKADHYIAETMNRVQGRTPIVLALNKVDLLAEDADVDEHLNLVEHDRTFHISAAEGTNVPELINTLRDMLPYGPRYYPRDQVSEVNMRFIAAEVIREQVIEHTEQEVPHSVAVGIEEFKERSEDLSYINAVIYVERDSQKGIILGKGGRMLKAIGAAAREQLQELVGTRIYLDLHVKVQRDWRQNPGFMKRIGYHLPDKKDK